MVNVFDGNVICRQYEDLKINSNLSLEKEDVPQEFSNEALKTINDFIGKTHNLSCEWVIYFDYKTGEILKCGNNF